MRCHSHTNRSYNEWCRWKKSGANHLGQKPGWNNGIYIGIFSISTCCRIFFPSTFVLCLCNLFEALAFASGGEGHHTQCSTALSGLVQVATGGPTPWEAWAMGNRCSWKDLKRNGTDGTRYWTTHNKTCTKTSLRLKFRLKAPGSIYFSIFFFKQIDPSQHMDYIMLKNHLEIDISFPHNIRRLSEELATIPARNGRSQPRWRRDGATELSVPAPRVAGHTEVKAGLLGVIRSINRNKKNGEKMKPPLVFWFLSMFFCVFCFSISLTFWQPVLFAPCRKKVLLSWLLSR